MVPASGSCAARTVALDVVFASRSELYGISEADYARGSMGGGRGRHSECGGPARHPCGERFRARVKAARRLSSGGGGITRSGLGRLTADLWLVRSTPGAADRDAARHVNAHPDAGRVCVCAADDSRMRLGA